MASFLTVVFYVAAVAAVVGALTAVLAESRNRRGIGLALVGGGLAGIYAALSEGLVALVVLVCYLALAATIASHHYGSLAFVTGISRRTSAPVAAVALAVLVFIAYRGGFAGVNNMVSGLGTGEVARLLFSRDALPAEAVVALLLGCVLTAEWAWRGHRR